MSPRWLWRRPCASLAAALVCALAATAAEPARWAILIGVNDYAHLQDLQFAGQDVVALSKRLAAAGFPEKHIFVLRDGAVESKYLPVKTNIEKQLDLVLTIVGRNDLVLFAFSGHGMHLDGVSYLCPGDADTDQPQKTMLAVDDIYSRLSRSPAAMKLVILDACRDDPRPVGRRSATPQEDRRNLAQAIERPPAGMKLLSSCGVGQVSYEDADLRHGVFMHFFLEGLGGQADANKNGKVSLGELYEFASSQTKVHVARKWSDYQVPYEKGELNGVFEFAPSVPVAGHILTNSIGMKLVLIPAGEFDMGTVAATYGEFVRRFPNASALTLNGERPQHRVRISRPFFMGQHEVTVGEFQQFAIDQNFRAEGEKGDVGGWGYNRATHSFEHGPQYTWRTPGFTQNRNHPVVDVSWNDAIAFCQWLSRREGKTYRLPTEAEWEYACRAGTRTLYCFGDDPEELAKNGNVADKMAKEHFAEWTTIQARDGYLFTAPVGQFLPNDFRLYDMHGNVSEWCSDWFGENYYANSPQSDPAGPLLGSERVVRGGRWDIRPLHCRAACRFALDPARRYPSTGFRVVLATMEAP